MRQLVQHDAAQSALSLVVSSFYRLYLEGELLLCQVTEADHDHCGQDLGYSGINIELLNKELDEDIIEANANQHQQKITEQLHSPLQCGAGKYDEPVQQVSCWKTDGERDQECHDMRADGPGECMYDLFIQDEIVTDIIYKYVKYGIATPTGRVPEGLQRHPFFEWRIEEIDYTSYQIFHCQY